MKIICRIVRRGIVFAFVLILQLCDIGRLDPKICGVSGPRTVG